MARRRGVGAGGAHPPATAHPSMPGCTHQPGDLVTADVMAGAAGRLPQLVRPVDPVVRHPQRDQDRHHHRVTQRPRRRRPGLRRVVGRRGDLQPCSQHPADRLDPEHVTVLRRCSRRSPSVGGRAPPRRKPTPTSRSRSPGAARGSPARAGGSWRRLRRRRTRPLTVRRCRPGSPTCAPTRPRSRAERATRCTPRAAHRSPRAAAHQPHRLILLLLRVPPRVGFAFTCSDMTPSSFPRSGASADPRAIHWVRRRPHCVEDHVSQGRAATPATTAADER